MATTVKALLEATCLFLLLGLGSYIISRIEVAAVVVAVVAAFGVATAVAVAVLVVAKCTCCACCGGCRQTESQLGAIEVVDAPAAAAEALAGLPLDAAASSRSPPPHRRPGGRHYAVGTNTASWWVRAVGSAMA